MERGCEEMSIISSQPFLYVFIFGGKNNKHPARCHLKGREVTTVFATACGVSRAPF